MIDGVPNNTPLPPKPLELDKKPLDKIKEPKGAGRAGNWNGNAGPQAECPSSCDGHGGRVGGHPRADGRGRYIQHRGLCAEDGAQRLHSPCRSCSGQGAGVLAAPLFQQSQLGGGSRQHLRGVPGEINGLRRDYEKLWGQVPEVLRELSSYFYDIIF